MWDLLGSPSHNVKFVDCYLNVMLCAAFDLLLRFLDSASHNDDRASKYSLSPLHYVG